MRLGTPRREQGQMVARSYGWHDGVFYRRTIDRSSCEVAWACADEASANLLAEEGYDPGGSDFVPDISEWIPCEDPDPEQGVQS